MPAPGEYNQVPPSNRREGDSNQSLSRARTSSRPTTASTATTFTNTASSSTTRLNKASSTSLKQSTLQFGARKDRTQNDSPCASTSRQPYIGSVDSEVKCLFRFPSVLSSSPLVLYPKSPLQPSLWDGTDQPYITLPPPKKSHVAPTTKISSLPCVAVVVPTPRKPP